MIEHPSSGSLPAHALGTEITRPCAGVVALSVRGEVDTLTSGRLDAALDELLADPEGKVLVVDLARVTFLASSGLAVLIRAAQLAATRNLRLRVVARSRAVRRPLEITGVDQLFDLHADVESACHPD